MINFNEQQLKFLEMNVYKQLGIKEVNKSNAESVLDFLFDNFEVKYSQMIINNDKDVDAQKNLAFLDTITNELTRYLNI